MLGRIKKTLCIGFLLAVYSVVSVVGRWFSKDDPRLFLIRSTHRCARKLLRALGIEVCIEGHDPATVGQYLVVANHVSYLDVLVIAATLPSVFVTSVEVSRMPFLGFLARCAGSLFVERRNRNQLLDEVSLISQTLKEGFNVVIFPEGTSTSGSEVVPFKMSLLDAAVRSQVDVLPICLNYERINAEKVGVHSRDWIFYYGDMEFFPHLKGLLSLRSISLTMKLLSPIVVRPTSTRKELAKKAYEDIRGSYLSIS